MIDEKLLEDFIQDGLTLIDEANDQLGSDGCNLSGVNAIFRCLHTLKGASGFLGLDGISHFVHRFEDTLKLWQEAGKGLDQSDAQIISQGLKLTQDALVKATDKSFVEKDEYKNFLTTLEKFKQDTSKVTFQSLEEKMTRLKNQFDIEKEGIYQKDLIAMTNRIDKILDSLQSVKNQAVLPVIYKNLKSVVINGQDITEACVKTFEGLELVALKGKNAFANLNLDELNQYLITISRCLPGGGNLLGWEIIQDICDVSIQIVDEAVRRFWTEGVTTVAKIEMQAETKQDEIKKDSQEITSEIKPDSKPDEHDEEKTEEYIRISASIIQRMSDYTGDLVADRNSMENLIQEMGGIIPARYKRHLQDNYTSLDKHVNLMERELNHLSNRQLNDVFRRLPNMVKSLCDSLEKKVNLKITGGEIEIPRDLIRALSDPLVHIVRNSIDHGIEKPTDRAKLNKSAEGNLTISAVRNEDRITITIQDDGKGLDKEIILKKAITKNLIPEGKELEESEIFNLIFLPGFSTVEKATDVSGRGVGMDVVKTAVESKGGRIKLESSKGKGMTLELILPLEEGYRTQDVLLIQAGNQTYGIEYRCLKEILDVSKIDLHSYKESSFFEYRKNLIPYVNLQTILKDADASDKYDIQTGRILVIEDEQLTMLACRVDKVYRKVKVVVVPFIHEFLKENRILRGTAILGTGEPYPILDFRDVNKLMADR